MASSLCILHWSKITLWKSLMPFQQHSFKSRFGKISNTIVQLFAIIFPLERWWMKWTLEVKNVRAITYLWLQGCKLKVAFMFTLLDEILNFYSTLKLFLSVSFENFLMETIQSVIEKEIFENWKTKQMKTFFVCDLNGVWSMQTFAFYLCNPNLKWFLHSNMFESFHKFHN